MNFYLEAIRRRLYCSWPLLGRWVRRLAARQLIDVAFVNPAPLEAQVLVEHFDRRVVAIIREHLLHHANNYERQTIWELWAAQRQPALAALVEAWPELPEKP